MVIEHIDPNITAAPSGAAEPLWTDELKKPLSILTLIERLARIIGEQQASSNAVMQSSIHFADSANTMLTQEQEDQKKAAPFMSTSTILNTVMMVVGIVAMVIVPLASFAAPAEAGAGALDGALSSVSSALEQAVSSGMLASGADTTITTVSAATGIAAGVCDVASGDYQQKITNAQTANDALMGSANSLQKKIDGTLKAAQSTGTGISQVNNTTKQTQDAAYNNN